MLRQFIDVPEPQGGSRNVRGLVFEVRRTDFFNSLRHEGLSLHENVGIMLLLLLRSHLHLLLLGSHYGGSSRSLDADGLGEESRGMCFQNEKNIGRNTIPIDRAEL